MQEPFLLVVHYNDPHWPYDPPPPHGAEWIAGYHGGLTPHDTGRVVEREDEPVHDLDPADLAYLVGLYDSEVHFADANLGDLLSRIGAAGLRRPVLPS